MTLIFIDISLKSVVDFGDGGTCFSPVLDFGQSLHILYKFEVSGGNSYTTLKKHSF
ncbi:MAG: hypothetical protein ACKVOU_15510 [Cytophagales bacterium]